MTFQPIRLQSESGRMYTLQRRLEEGGYGAVFEALDETKQQQVAVKVLMDPQSSDGLRRFYGEVDILRGLDHPNIIQVIDYGMSGHGHPWYVMEKFQGSAVSVVNRQRQWQEVQSIVEEIAEALAAYHALGGIHRDIKLDNILIDENGCAVLADFGVARCSALDGRTMTRGPLGTFPYIAPEMAHGAAGFKSDVYALGIVLWELGHGELHDPAQVGIPPKWTAGPGTAQQLYNAMVQRDAATRPTAAQILKWLKDTELDVSTPANNNNWLGALFGVVAVGALVGVALKALGGGR